MHRDSFDLTVEAADQGQAGAAAQALADTLRETDGVLEAERRKLDPSTMDLGLIVQVVMTSGATLALAQGVADWLRGRRGVKLSIVRDPRSDSIKVTEGVDPETATRTTEMVRNA